MREKHGGNQDAGLQKAEEAIQKVEALTSRIDEFKQSVSDTITRFGGRIGDMEAKVKVDDERHKYVIEKVDALSREVRDFQKESKDSIGDLRKETKEKLEEIRVENKAGIEKLDKGNESILSTLTEIKHKTEDVDALKKDVDEIKGRDGKTWADIKGKLLMLTVGLIFAMVCVALGLSAFL